MKFCVSQAEMWARKYTIEAESLDKAKEIYKKYGYDRIESEILAINDPEYIDEIPNDVIWFDEDGGEFV